MDKYKLAGWQLTYIVYRYFDDLYTICIQNPISQLLQKISNNYYRVRETNNSFLRYRSQNNVNEVVVIESTEVSNSLKPPERERWLNKPIKMEFPPCQYIKE